MHNLSLEFLRKSKKKKSFSATQKTYKIKFYHMIGYCLLLLFTRITSLFTRDSTRLKQLANISQHIANTYRLLGSNQLKVLMLTKQHF